MLSCEQVKKSRAVVRTQANDLDISLNEAPSDTLQDDQFLYNSIYMILKRPMILSPPQTSPIQQIHVHLHNPPTPNTSPRSLPTSKSFIAPKNQDASSTSLHLLPRRLLPARPVPTSIFLFPQETPTTIPLRPQTAPHTPRADSLLLPRSL